MTVAATAANSAVPAGAFRKRPAADQADAKGHAAGVLFVAPDGHVLLLHRSGDEANFAHHWALPGGGVEAGETPELGADREVHEEMGVEIPGKKRLLDQRRTPTGMVFHTFVQPVAEKFAPKLNGEHSGFTWAPLDALPGPLHPAVESTLKERIGSAQDMSPEDWRGLRDGFLKWTGEEEGEAEHAEDALCATDESTVIAMDKDSSRTKSMDGHLHVRLTNISKATVNPYRGAEIPNAGALGLDPNKIYHLLRDPEELAKGAATFNGKPFLRQHVPSKSTEHSAKVTPVTIGATGTDATFEDPYLKVSLSAWPQEDIDDIESEMKNELSSGYHYRADMTPGIFRGMPFDGIMRDIVGNHVALVKDGRAGSDVIVGDSMENVMTKPTRFAALALGLAAAAISPMMAMDAKLELPKDAFSGITTKNFQSKKAELLAGVRKALDGKLRKGMALDASMAEVGKVMDTIGGMFEGGSSADESVSEEQHKAMEAAAHGESNLGIPKAVGQEYVSKDAAALGDFLKSKGMDAESIKTACDMFPKNAMDESEEEKTKREEAEAKAKKAEDELKAKDAEMKEMVSKPAMDQAIDAAVKGERARQTALYSAREFVKPWIGEIAPTLAMDTAEDVYRHAATTLGVADAKNIHASALPTLIGLVPKPGERNRNSGPAPMAMDSAQAKDFSTRFPNAGRIGAA